MDGNHAHVPNFPSMASLFEAPVSGKQGSESLILVPFVKREAFVQGG